MKKIEDAKKWKCLTCDPNPLARLVQDSTDVQV